MRGLNQMIVVGNLGDDVQLKTSKDGRPWAQLSVATSRPRREGDAWVDQTDWHRVRVFGAEAERCARFLKKGSLVAVDGSLTYEKWTDDEGENRVRTVVVARQVQFLGGLTPRAAAEASVAAEA